MKIKFCSRLSSSLCQIPRRIYGYMHFPAIFISAGLFSNKTMVYTIFYVLITEFPIPALYLLPRPFVLSQQQIRRIACAAFSGKSIAYFLDLNIRKSTVFKFHYNICNKQRTFCRNPRTVIGNYLLNSHSFFPKRSDRNRFSLPGEYSGFMISLKKESYSTFTP